ncbi:MAG TPA: hypothetical protein O0W90_02220 [Methanocorpusculum sp.]|nr:hypothetical protein [Methanocorpusculum sp.]
MKKIRWEAKLSIVLVLLTLLIYILKILIIGDAGTSNTLTYIFNALGFLPLNVLFVTLIISGLLSRMEKQRRADKMRMVLGIFFSEIGSDLMNIFVKSDSSSSKIKDALNVKKDWDKSDFKKAADEISLMCPTAKPCADDFEQIKTKLAEKKDFILRIIENPVFLENEAISRIMQNILHISDELTLRKDLSKLPKSDMNHLAGDVNRVYCDLMKLWLTHMEYLSENYPHLFSLSIRASPFSKDNNAIVME